MAKDLVLISGISGFLGFRVLATALQHGYRVRGAVRRQAQIDQIKAVPELKPYLNNLEIVIVEDILKEGAFDEAAKDAKYILHVASPISLRASDDFYNSLIQPALQGTLGMLRSAAKTPSVKRVIITSSVAVLSLQPEDGHAVSVDEVYAPPDPHSKFPDAFRAYGASKSIAYAGGKAWVKAEKPSFDVISILPSVILGPNQLVTSPEGYQSGTNRYVINVLEGKRVENPSLGSTVHVDDVALAHVKALSPEVEGNQDFLLSTPEHVNYDDAISIAKKYFPDAFEDGRLSAEGHLPQVELNFDVTKTEKILGIKWRGFEDQVKGIVSQYLQFVS